MATEFAEGTRQVEFTRDAVRDLEATLGPELVQELAAASLMRGGEQY